MRNLIHRRALSLAVLALLVLGSLPFAASAQDAARKGGLIDWTPDLEPGLATAETERRPMMIYFTHDH